jgi:hypothetical protein
MKQEDLDDLVKMREDALDFRKKAEEEILKKFLERK